jgi:hypothetical protein
VLHHTWGPPARNFEREFQLAHECCADPQLPMEGVSVFVKAIEPGVAEFKGPASEFKTIDEFKTNLRSQLSSWLAGKDRAPTVL